MLIESRELHKRFEEKGHELSGLELDGFIKAQLILNEYEGEILEEDYKDYLKHKETYHA